MTVFLLLGGSECVVSVRPRPWPKPDPQVAAAIQAIYRGRREVPLAVRVRDRLGELFPDASFVEAFGRAGKPGWSPGRLALVTVLQKAASLTDRQAADEVRENLAWKYALGLGLEDPGFDHSVLSEFRSRVVTHGLEERVLDLLLERLRTLDLLASGGSQRTDSTHIVAAVRDLNRLELAGESVRAALNALAAACPDWVDQVLVVDDWASRYADRIDTWRLPSSRAGQNELALHYAQDGFTLLQAVHAPGSPAWLRELSAVQTLRCVLVQNYTRTADRAGRLRIRRRERAEDGGDGLPPAPSRLASPYDTDTRWSAKRDLFWNGYKLHVSETCHPQADGDRPTRPNLITNVTTTCSTLPDSRALEAIHQALHRRHLLPARHYLDSGYPSADLIVSCARTYGIALVTPVLLDTSRQAKAQQGFAAHDFTVDWDGSQAVCPAGKASATWNDVVQEGVAKTVVSFAALDCVPCPVKQQCTSSRKGRWLSLYPRELTEAIRTARAQQQDGTWQRDYALRAGVEGTVRQATHTTGLRRAPYRFRFSAQPVSCRFAG
ncbi:transposase [Streptomyces milbemycinicus]|uniref:transposase n=1 Tax=Streptomyces milbemycinicus TaxID=476552 RepID=UPI0033E2745D